MAKIFITVHVPTWTKAPSLQNAVTSKLLFGPHRLLRHGQNLFGTGLINPIKTVPRTNAVTEPEEVQCPSLCPGTVSFISADRASVPKEMSIQKLEDLSCNTADSGCLQAADLQNLYVYASYHSLTYCHRNPPAPHIS